jgi:hypothetical protein
MTREDRLFLKAKETALRNSARRKGLAIGSREWSAYVHGTVNAIRQGMEAKQKRKAGNQSNRA